MIEIIEAAYHGTNSFFDTFDPSKCKSGIIFFSTVEGFAREWAIDHAREGKPLIVTVNLTLSNPWDYQNPQQVSLLLEAMLKKGIQPIDEMLFEEGIIEGDWMSIERTEGLIQCIRELGHDAFYVTEGSDCDRNIAIFDAEKITVIGHEWVGDEYLAGRPINKKSLNSN